jgi:hypothetical protein
MRKFIMRSIRFIKGFTLVEILLSFGVIAVVAGISISTFSSYNKSQIFSQGVSDFKDLLGVSRSRAISQVKPPSCGATPLEGYEVRVTISGVGYSQYVKCGGVYYLMAQRRLPQQLAFSSGSVSSILFNVSTGTVTTPGSIIIAGLDKSNTVLIEKTGRISVSITGALVGGPTTPPASPTPGNVCTAQNAAYWNHPIAGCVYVGPGYSAATHCNSSCTWAIGSQEPAAGPTTPPGAPTATSGACTKDYYYSPPSHCTYVGGNRGSHCDSTCGGATVPTATPAPASTQAPAPTSGMTPTSGPVATATPGSCSRDYYYYAVYSYCTFVGGNNGTHCDAACTRTN